MHMTTTCGNCKKYVALVPTEDPRIFAAMEFEKDRYTPSTRRHICGESDRRPY